LALINSRPQSPTKSELVALIAPTLPQSQTSEGTIVPRREAWRALVAEHDAAHDVSGNMTTDDPREPQAMAFTAAVDRRLIALHDELWATPAQTPSDIRLLGEIAFRTYWPGCDWDDPDSEVR